MIGSFIFGTAQITFKTENSKKVFSYLSQKEIPFSHHVIEGTSSKIRIPIYNRKKILPIEGLITVERRGLPALLYQYRHRYGILAGAIIAAVTVALSGQVIWRIDVKGNRDIPDAYVKERLREIGIYEGSVSKNLDFSMLNNRFLTESEGIAWISVNLNGTCAVAEVRESKERNTHKKTELCNLVAAEDGQIEQVSAIEGKPCVKIGDTVQKGEVLVSGVIVHGEDRLRFESAKSSVTARVKRSFRVEVPFEYEKKVYTGDKKRKITVSFFKNSVNLFGNSRIPYAFYDTIVTEKKSEINGLSLPVSVYIKEYREYTPKREILSLKDARTRLMCLYREELIRTLGSGTLISKTVKYEASDSAVSLNCSIECADDIALSQSITVKE